MSYQKDRAEFISRMQREGLQPETARALLREATGLNRRAELACSSEAADKDRVPCPATRKGPCLCYESGTHSTIPRITLEDWRAEQRVKALLPSDWKCLTSGDPRGYTLRVIPPSYAERNKDRGVHNLDNIGVPPGPSRLRF